ncbi:hypothetical protein SAMN02745174_00974 [Cetobacterium ceti]|uniref:Uncharacterized protein n=1 Tax=Cetobacterium ceti TaxID=180163 RepID=A0A1T4LUQ0_9FUSO|nr:hypothetical protein [Cetobacterium ceti]SJZ58356.1 hypothetical protein SAMN02745174_00974 [Cetobacterium ceti]
MDKINLKILILTSVGMNTKEIGKLLKLSKETINRRKSQLCRKNLWSSKLNDLKRLDLYVEEKNIKLERVFLEEILVLLILSEKMPYSKISEIVNYSERTIKRRAKEIKKRYENKDEPLERVTVGTYKKLLHMIYIECCYRV